LNKRFEQQVLKLRPNLRAVDGYFYTTPVDHVLCGFVYEKGSGGAHIWRYALPLYDHLEFIHLGFGERLPYPPGVMRTEHKAASEDAIAFVRCIEPYETATYGWQSTEAFLLRTESLLHLGNPWILRGHAMTLIMLGRRSEAELQMKMLSSKPGIENIPHFQEDLRHVSAELSRGVEHAQRCLLTWEAETKARFGVNSSR
jgi:hypothetical protein